jgi:hypothetical protein
MNFGRTIRVRRYRAARLLANEAAQSRNVAISPGGTKLAEPLGFPSDIDTYPHATGQPHFILGHRMRLLLCNVGEKALAQAVIVGKNLEITERQGGVCLR